MADIYGISSQMYEELAAFCEKYHVLVTLRSRASEAISLIEEGLSVVKPAAVKLKTVQEMDIQYLGFPSEVAVQGKDVSSVGQVVIREPIFLSPECAAACALEKFKASLAGKGVAEGSSQFYELQYRWIQRYGEWTNPGPGLVPNLDKAAQEGKITLDWHWQENHIDPASTPTPETVGFRLQPGPDGSRIPEICESEVVAEQCTSGWKSITGDVDLVSVTAADGSALSDEEYRDLLVELGANSVDIQHPATATWYSSVNDDTAIFDPTNPEFADKAKYMAAGKCCVMQVGPNGHANAVMLDLNGSYFTSKNDYYLNYVGGYKAAAP